MADNSVRGFSAYLAEFPAGKYAGQAGDNISRLLKTPNAAAAPVTMTAMTEPAAAARPTARKFILSNVRVEAVKLTGRLGLGLPDQLFLRFNTGQRFPEGKSDIYSIKRGESWAVPQSFELDQPVSLQLREFDDIGGSDNIGTIDLGDTPGMFTKTLDCDASDYRVTYTLTVG